MAERRKVKKKLQEPSMDEELQPTKIEYTVAKFMKNSVPTKKTKFLGHPVTYFIANKAIDVLLDSQWASGENALFSDRESVAYFCNKMLEHKFFHRAKKIAVSDKDYSVKVLKKKREREESKKKKEKEEDKKNECDSPKPDNSEEDKKKKKTKIKLDMHLEQVFVDSSDAYVWIYDPVPFWYYIVGGLLLFGAVAVCLFPLWPPFVRQGVYYLSLAAAGFLGVILALTILRFIIFVLIWVLSLGKHHFWILPNLTEDVGFFESFWPLYRYSYRGEFWDDSNKQSKKRKKAGIDDGKEKSSNGDSKTENDETNNANQSNGEADKQETTDVERLEDRGPSDSESNSNSFELLNGEELSSDPNGSDKEKPKEL